MKKKIIIIVILFVAVFYGGYYLRSVDSGILELRSVNHTEEYELLAKKPQDISSDFLFLIYPSGKKEYKKQEAIGWTKNNNFIIFSAHAYLQDLKQNVDYTVSLSFKKDDGLLNDIKLVINNNEYLCDFNGDYIFDVKVSFMEGKRSYFINQLGGFQIVKNVNLDDKTAIDSMNNELVFVNGEWQNIKN